MMSLYFVPFSGYLSKKSLIAFTLASLGLLTSYSVMGEGNYDPVVEDMPTLLSKSFSCTFKHPSGTETERTELFAHYVQAQEPVRLREFKEWIALTYPWMTKLQCMVMEDKSGTLEFNPEHFGEISSSEDIDLSIQYIYEHSATVNDQPSILSEQASGQRFKDEQGRVIAVAFSGRIMQTGGVTDHQPFKGSLTILTTCLGGLKAIAVTPLSWGKILAERALPPFLYERTWTTAYALWYGASLKDHLE